MPGCEDRRAEGENVDGRKDLKSMPPGWLFPRPQVCGGILVIVGCAGVLPIIAITGMLANWADKVSGPKGRSWVALTLPLSFWVVGNCAATLSSIHGGVMAQRHAGWAARVIALMPPSSLCAGLVAFAVNPGGFDVLLPALCAAIPGYAVAGATLRHLLREHQRGAS